MKVIRRILKSGTKYEIPYFLINGNKRGETVMITAGVHGNEPGGVRAAYELLQRLRSNVICIVKGSLIVVPLVNNQAYKRRIRGVPDLNRTFPRSHNDSARHPVSAALFQLAKLHRVAWYLDLHEANGLSQIDSGVLGQTLIANPGSKAVQVIKRVASLMNRSIVPRNKHFNIRVRGLPGSGRHSAHWLLHTKAVTVETSWSLPIQDRVEYQKDILRLLLKEAGLLS
jgi:predicted deacylase